MIYFAKIGFDVHGTKSSGKNEQLNLVMLNICSTIREQTKQNPEKKPQGWGRFGAAASAWFHLRDGYPLCPCL